MTFKTVVPQQPVVAGESFQVQYILEDAEKPGYVEHPVFKDFRVVTGPNTYPGSVTAFNRTKQLRNTVYTLAAIKPGRFIIPGARVTVNGKRIKSDDVVVEVISKEEAAKRFNKQLKEGNSEYVLRPGEDVYEKIRKNLFLKVLLDRRTCYVGEAVVATFKLYSRLESRSDIVKNPGFYGFTVYDIINLTDQQTDLAIIDGRSFDVHTIRKVQLYPLQAGQFMIDPMEVKNKVEFSKSFVNKNTEQQIIEGVLGNETETKSFDPNITVFESTISTEPVAINVKPFPVKGKPVVYNGATGDFTIAASLQENVLNRNDEGRLVITISGSGNFTQLEAPVVQWPPGIEGFEPVVRDELDKTRVPLHGKRSFHYSFVSAKPGTYTIPGVNFSYFNPGKQNYKIISTPALALTVSASEKKPLPITDKNLQSSGSTIRDLTGWWVAGLSLVIATILGLIIMTKKKAERKRNMEAQPVRSASKPDEFLQPALLWLKADEKSFYAALHQSIWKFFTHHFSLTGSEMNKASLEKKLREINLSEKHILKILSVLQQCERGLFTNTDMDHDRTRLLEEVKQVLSAIEPELL